MTRLPLRRNKRYRPAIYPFTAQQFDELQREKMAATERKREKELAELRRLEMEALYQIVDRLTEVMLREEQAARDANIATHH